MHETNPAEVIIGVDTHKHAHAAVAITALGTRLGMITIPASHKGYQELEAWARSFGPVRAYGVEGSGSYGAGLSRFLQASGHTVLEVNRPHRQLRYQHGKSDPLDAEGAARAVLSGQADALAKSGTRAVEMIRHLKVARDQLQLGRNLAGQLFSHKLVAHPRQKDHAFLLVGEPGVMHDLLWVAEHAGRMGQSLHEWDLGYTWSRCWDPQAKSVRWCGSRPWLSLLA